MGPSLYAWYHLLDAFIPGTSKPVIAVKIVADAFCLGKSSNLEIVGNIYFITSFLTGIPYLATYYSGDYVLIIYFWKLAY